MAKLFVSFDACLKTPKNKFGVTPQEMICTKAPNQRANKENCELIKSLFEQCLFVPLYRDEDMGNVIVEMPKDHLDLDKANRLVDQSTLKSPAFSRTSHHQSNRKLAAYVGPVSPTIVILFFLLLLLIKNEWIHLDL